MGVQILLYLNKKSTHGVIAVVNLGQTVQIIKKLQHPDRRAGKRRQNYPTLSHVQFHNNT